MDTASSGLSMQQLFANRLLRVPDYQRGYAWEREQRTDFLEDLEVLSPGMEHYTGTIVLHRLDGHDSPLDAEGRIYTLFDVVDGQQRLTTAILLLDAIRRALLSMDAAAEVLAEGIRRNYVATRDIAGQPLYKLSLGPDCDHYFKNSALSDQPGPEGPQISSEQRLADARSEFEQSLRRERNVRGDAFPSWLTDLYVKVTTQLRVSLYQVESAAEVGVIFEVMNNRGKPLSELEKVKNYLLYVGSKLNVPHNLGKTVNDAWAEIFRQLMAAGLTQSTDEDQLLRAHWLTYYDPQPRTYNGSKSIKAKFDIRRFRDDHPALLDGLLRYTEGLRACCIAYSDARAPERADSFASLITNKKLQAEVRRWSAKLTRTNVVAPFLPLLLATRIRYAEDGARYLELVRLCEAFAFRVYRLLNRRADAGQAQLFRIGCQLGAETISFDQALDQVRATLHLLSPASTLGSELRAEYTNWYEWAGLKYFLYEYEEHLASQRGATPKISWDEVRKREKQDTVEHILPQTATNAYWRDRFDLSARARYTNDLGNLSLTKDNAVYGNKPFPAKRGQLGSPTPCYANSPFFTERELAVLDDWTPAEVEKRRERMISWALERWKVSPQQALPDHVEVHGEGHDADEDDLGWTDEATASGMGA